MARAMTADGRPLVRSLVRPLAPPRGIAAAALAAVALAAVALAAVALLLVTTACGPQKYRSVGVDPAHVTRIEMGFSYFVPLDEESPPQADQRTTVNDPAQIKALVDAFTDMPVGGIGNAWERASWAESTSLKFILDDGSTVKLRQVFIKAHDVIIVWDDGTESHTEWGMSLLDQYFYGDQG